MSNMRHIINLLKESDNDSRAPTLYHGTCLGNAQNILMNGWQPRSGMMGGNMGQSKYLYLSSEYEDAMWFANEKGCDTVIEIHNIPISYLKVDPEDGTSDTVEEELGKDGLPGKVVLFKALDSSHFKLTS